MNKRPRYQLIRHGDGTLRVERDSVAIGYVFEMRGGLGCSLFRSDATPAKQMSKEGLLAWVRRQEARI